MPPPESSANIFIVHKINKLYQEIYRIGSNLPKRDKLGIYSKIENGCVEILSISIEAALQSKDNKIEFLKKLHIKIEILKHLIRTCFEIQTIKDRTYYNLEITLQEVSKMASGWLKYQTQKELG